MTSKEYRVIGPPGTGKTTWMARQVKQAVEKYGPAKVLVTSFTRAAAREIAGRDLGLALEEMGNVGTLHALCFRALGRPKVAEAHLQEWNRRVANMSSWCCDGQGVDLDDLGVMSTSGTLEGDRLRMKANRWRSLRIPLDKWAHTPEGRWFAEWKRWLREANLIDFTGMIERALEECLVAPGSPTIAYVDEVQDMSPLELALVRSWSSHMEGILLAGDPDQSIYDFKGASPRAFYEPEIPQEMYRVLGQGWRVPAEVHAWSTRWIQQATDHRPVMYAPRAGDKGYVQQMEDPEHNFDTLDEWLDTVLEFTEEKSLMVLASCSYMLTPAIRALRNRGVPFHNPYRVTRGDWNPMRGGVDRVMAFCAYNAGDRMNVWTWRELAKWTELFDAKGAIKHGGRVLIDTNAKNSKTQDQTVNDVELTALLEPAFLSQAREALVGKKPWDWLQRSCNMKGAAKITYATTVADRGGVIALQDKPRVIVGTVHSVKGGEADVVLCSPDLSPAGWSEFEGEGHDGVVRLFYVAGTRARESLLLASRASQYAVW